ncbi:MAG: DEAD/DEAH box helicase [Bifidobacteriaceae bacterium]|jgi:SNF2 family DNA or RNA helicase|nr:DEAD/DEAH box helicase [Bifidobacteriaceae bacterium]
MSSTPHQLRFFAEQLMLQRPQDSIEGLVSSMSGVKVDLNPHQVDAALFALQSPLSNGALLADEVGLGKTIEAGLVLAQYWSERKRKILLIVTASLRTQWRTELEEKFFIRSEILELKNYNKTKKNNPACNPFSVTDSVVVCSYNFASAKMNDLRAIDWDLVIMDEAHKLRNVYKRNNVMGANIRNALCDRKKLLLTATPLQNNLMELYGLVSLIDERVFGSVDVFREMYVNGIADIDLRNQQLKSRLQNFCKRTLRQQVLEYVPYTNRIAILQEYTPSQAEEELYNSVSEYLQRDNLYGFPQRQRTLLTLIARKLLASSSMAIHGTLATVIERLKHKLDDYTSLLTLNDFDDYDGIDELTDEESDVSEADTITELEIDCQAIKDEIAELERYAELASNITTNAKGDNLILALDKGFVKNEQLGGQRKAVVFTESRRTQKYLMNLLTQKGYEGQIVFLDGSNTDPVSTRVYKGWKERHKYDGAISGSITADRKSAIVEEFRDRASILIGTEAAAEGINLQFCNIVVNYDLPWNPQRIEQRIGRCHRYGQKNDVIVINFLNRANAADVRVFDILSQKFSLFEGVFGSSDEVLGVIEDGVDFEKRILGIYQSCRSPEEIKTEFDKLQDELFEKINEKLIEARHSILENFDEEVAARLRGCSERTKAGLDKFSRWLCDFFIMWGAEQIEPLDEFRFVYKENGERKTYNLNWKDAEQHCDEFLRRDGELVTGWLSQAMNVAPPSVAIRFIHSALPQSEHISFLDSHPNLRGIVSIDKLTHKSIQDEEYLIMSVITEDDTEVDADMLSRIMELHAEIIGECLPETETLIAARNAGVQGQKDDIADRNKTYFMEQVEKLDAYSEDLKEGLQKQLKALKKEITEKRKVFNNSKDTLKLDDMLELRSAITTMVKKRQKMERDIGLEEDRINAENERLQDDIRKRLNGDIETHNIMTFSFEIV